MQISIDPIPALAASAVCANPMPAWKRVLDLFCCVLALPILALAVLVMSGVTWLVSPGPVLFRQERIGLAGSRFRIFKFRTMKVDADQTVHSEHFKQLVTSNVPMVKLDAQRDARLIPGGWFLRATGMDELPQIINVLRGDMSIVGPRPCIPSEFAQFQPAQRERVDAVPGLTGLWQVSGKNRTTFEEMIRFDIRYARSVSLPLDLKIMLLTPLALGQQVYDTQRRRAGAARNGTIPAVVPCSVSNSSPGAIRLVTH
jgi:lipopolysaccharide/colanic/teichoic acid biosynthesis glycosyltransferase